MTRKRNLSQDENNGRKILKPVVEKKRRDRINQSLGELKSLLSRYTSDARLQNPKIEKAAILDLAVEYLRSWTDGQRNGCAPAVPIETAGIHHCITHLDGYMQKISPSQSTGLIRELKHYMDNHPKNTDAEPRPSSCKRPSSLIYSFNNSVGLHHDYLSPPPSPYFGCPSSTYTTPPPFPPITCHFSFSPRATPLSPNTSFPTPSWPTTPSVSLSPTTHSLSSPIFTFPSPTAPRRTSAALTPRGSPPTNSTSAVWRPWF
uniref:Hairy-related 11 n=1 Tax=Gadus morhua TaxID=8049 RepID=A0A8C5CSD6_GADMO